VARRKTGLVSRASRDCVVERFVTMRALDA